MLGRLCKTNLFEDSPPVYTLFGRLSSFSMNQMPLCGHQEVMVTLTLMPLLAAGVFKCALQLTPQVATSGDKRRSVVVLYEGKILIYDRGSKKPTSVTRWSNFGHHQQVVMNQDGSAIAIYDEYAGMEVFDGKGFKMHFFDPQRTLSEAELSSIPGKWACHMEGTWLKNPKFEFGKERLSFTIYNGRRINLTL